MTGLGLLVWGFAALALSAEPNAAAEQPDAIAQSRTLRRQLLAQQNAAVAEPTALQQDAALTTLIEQVLSLEWPAATLETTIAAAPAQAPAAAAASAAAPAPAEPAAPAPATEASAGEPLQRLDTAAAVPHPLPLADTLYRSGRPDLALRYYEQALAAADKKDPVAYPWLLFQTANCHSRSDTARAAALYDELIGAYPNSVWAMAAQARRRMLDWLHVNNEELKAHNVQ